MTNDVETHRCVIETRRRVCTLMVRRIGDRVELLHHKVLSTGATLTGHQAVQLAGYLIAAARREET